MQTLRLRLPNGTVTSGRTNTKTVNGYRKAYAQVKRSYNSEYVTVSGRVSAKRGFSEDRIHKFEVNMNGSNRNEAFRSDEPVYAAGA